MEAGAGRFREEAGVSEDSVTIKPRIFVSVKRPIRCLVFDPALHCCFPSV